MSAPAAASSAATYRAAVAAVYRRFLRQIRAHHRHRVKTSIHEEVRREFSIPLSTGAGAAGGDEGARLLARSLLALTWLKRAAADPLSGR